MWILRPFSPPNTLHYCTLYQTFILSVADYWLEVGMSFFIESEFKSRLFDISCQRHKMMTYHCLPSILYFLLTSTSKINCFYLIAFLKKIKKIWWQKCLLMSTCIYTVVKKYNFSLYEKKTQIIICSLDACVDDIWKFFQPCENCSQQKIHGFEKK